MQPLRNPRHRTGYNDMAKDSDGRKFNRIPAIFLLAAKDISEPNVQNNKFHGI